MIIAIASWVNKNWASITTIINYYTRILAFLLIKIFYSTINFTKE